MILLGAFLVMRCLAVGSAADQITAGDVAPAFPGMETVDGATPLALAPAPGVQRTFHLPELARWAERFHLPSPPAEICVERPAAPLDRAKALAAMHASLPEAEISILDWSRAPVPDGEVVFPANQLRSGAAGQSWSGYVRYGGSHQFWIWAKVTVRVASTRVMALHDLPPGQPISSDAVAVEPFEGLPGDTSFAHSLEQVAGKWPRAPISAGTALNLGQLRNPLDVTRGETVHVDVQSGAAHLEFDAQAEASGAAGDAIPVTNPLSHRRFTARITGKGRVVVDDTMAQRKS